MDFLLDVDWNCRDFQRFDVLLVFSFPNELGIKRRVARVANRRRRLLLVGYEAAQFFGRNIGFLFVPIRVHWVVRVRLRFLHCCHCIAGQKLGDARYPLPPYRHPLPSEGRGME